MAHFDVAFLASRLHHDTMVPIPHPTNWRRASAPNNFLFDDDDEIVITVNDVVCFRWSRSGGVDVDILWHTISGAPSFPRFALSHYALVLLFRRTCRYLAVLLRAVAARTPWAHSVFPSFVPPPPSPPPSPPPPSP